MKPHICFVALNAYPLLCKSQSIEFIGGAELQQVIVAKLLRERGFRVSFICLDHGQTETVEVGGIVVHRAYRSTAGLPGLRFIFPRLVNVWHALSKANADIYYHRTAGMLTGVVAAYCRRNNRKSIFAAAGDPDLEYNTPRIRFWRDRKIFEYGVRNVDRIVVQNENQRRLCQLNYRRQAVRIPNCLHNPAVPNNISSRYVLWVSMIRSLKQPQLMIDIAIGLPQYKFVMIGGRDQFEPSFYDEIEARANSIQNLDFVGYVPFDQVDQYFDNAAIVVNTSSSEGFPNTFLQAWSRRIPTISFVDCGASDGGRPIGLRAISIQDMSCRINELMDDDDLRRTLGRQSYEYYLANHSPSVVSDKYESLLRDLWNPIG